MATTIVIAPNSNKGKKRKEMINIIDALKQTKDNSIDHDSGEDTVLGEGRTI
eukprot:CAMPEP_0170786930 /NCGR_PEP_ID=MMETSP0733-20121128/17989_1 /TAXON_ID=186038 /ORGANISM="Fragilariopsis kerguelensis, Strain L26-C5" /LENGTH=51 /DNA_ID=CAMNT_0011133057 /DNA_START=303 /DNA_END=458 /DNA_ORIENTATION=+